jgi:hypothetical protein
VYNESFQSKSPKGRQRPVYMANRPLTYVSRLLAIAAIVLACGATTSFSVSNTVISPAGDQGKPKSLEISPALRDYCGIIYACGLKVRAGTCPTPKELGTPAPFSPDGDRCVEARELEARGLKADHPEYGFRLYRLLGFEYRVVYNIPDTVVVSRARLEYLLDDIPFAAKLISHYRQTPYKAEYVNAARTQFKGEKGARLRGEARLISGTYAEGRLIYLGTGVAEVAFWTLVGPGMMDFTYREIPATAKSGERIAYNLKVVVFPGNGMINSIMNMGIFRSVVSDKVRGVLTDITETAKLLKADQGKQLLKNPQWSAEDRKKIEALLKLE